jgi:Ca2+-binding RTX toxin-like protein
VTVDTVSPTVEFTAATQNWNGSFVLTGSVSDSGIYGAGEVVKVYDGTAYLGSTKADSNGQWSFTTASLANTTHTFSAMASDQAGNVGNSTGAAIYGALGKSTLVGTSGDDLLTGGGLRGVLGIDTFTFSGSHFGNDVVTDFQAQGWLHDVIQFDKEAFSSFAAVMAHAEQVGSDVVITHDAANSVTLKNVSISSLGQSDFHFV